MTGVRSWNGWGSRGRRLRSGALVLAVATVSTMLTPVSAAQAAFSTTPRVTWSPNGTVFAVAVSGDRVYIGGKFTSVRNPATGQSVARTRLAAFDVDTGALVTSFAPSADGEVRSITVSADGTRIFVGGAFTTVNGTGRSRLAALDPTGSLVAGWGASASGTVRDLALVDGHLFAAGTFGSVNGVSRGGLAKLVAGTGQLVPDWRVPTSGGKPWAIAPSPNGTDLVVAGAFTSLEGTSRRFLGSATLGTGEVTSWAPEAACDDCPLLHVLPLADAVYGAVGGPGGRVAKWPASGSTIQWERRTDGNVQALAAADGALYVGGHFGVFTGQDRPQLVAVSTASGSLLSWNPRLGGSEHPGVWALEATPTGLHIGGGFTSVSGQPRARYAELPSA